MPLCLLLMLRLLLLLLAVVEGWPDARGLRPGLLLLLHALTPSPSTTTAAGRHPSSSRSHGTGWRPQELTATATSSRLRTCKRVATARRRWALHSPAVASTRLRAVAAAASAASIAATTAAVRPLQPAAASPCIPHPSRTYHSEVLDVLRHPLLCSTARAASITTTTTLLMLVWSRTAATATAVAAATSTTAVAIAARPAVASQGPTRASL